MAAFSMSSFGVSPAAELDSKHSACTATSSENIKGNDIAKAGALKRKVQGELAGIHKELVYVAPFNTDEISKEIKLWADNFSEAVRMSDDTNIEKIVQKFIATIKPILKDSFTISLPLDKNSVLGSDGFTYNPMTIKLFQATVSAPFNNRSPLEPNNPAIFNCQPHVNVKCVCEWLEKHNALDRDEEAEKSFQQLMAQQKVVNISSAAATFVDPDLERIQQILAKDSQNKTKKTKKVNHLETQVKKIYKKYVEKHEENMSAINHKTEENSKSHENKIISSNEDFKDIVEQVKAIHDKLEREISKMEVETKKMQKQIYSVSDGVDMVRAQDIHLRQLIEEARIAKEKKEKKKKRLEKVLKTIAIVGASAFAIWGLSLALKAAGSSISAVVGPMKDGLGIFVKAPFSIG